MQPLICKLPEEKLPTAQITEQKATALPSGESIILQETATKVSNVSAQPAMGDVCARPIIESKSAKLPETTSTESAETITEQCKLASLAMLQQAALQDKSLAPENKDLLQTDLLQTDLQASMDTRPSTDAVCKSAVQEIVMPDSALPSTEAKSETPTVEAAMLPAIASIGADNSQKVIDLTQPLTIDPSEQHAEMLLAASEISTVSPVPIQVAESVLQAEPKESVSSAIVSDQAIATTVTAVHESTNVAPAAATTAEPVQLNGSACEVEKRGDFAPVSPVKTDAPAESTKQSASDVIMMKDVPSEVPLVTAEKMEPGSEEVRSKELSATVDKSAELVGMAIAETAQIAKTEAAKAMSTEQIAKMETKREESLEQIGRTESTEAKSIEPAKIAEEEAAAAAAMTKSQIGMPESPMTEQAPLTAESIGAKESNIPSTPTVIEATPPISPLAESAQALEEKVAKKNLKKSDSVDGAEAEGEDRKAKKTVKKTVKKSKTKPEEAAPSTVVAEGVTAAESSQGKAKKSVKVAKKTGLKTGQSLETDTSVPETPPPPSPASTTAPDVPIPPKRKTKNSGASGGNSAKGTTGKKPEAEE